MSDNLSVQTSELRSAALSHGQLADHWSVVAATPPHDPATIARSWGVVAQPAVDQLGLSNDRRTRDATTISGEHRGLAGKLQTSARAYDATDEDGEHGVKAAVDRLPESRDAVHQRGSGPNDTRTQIKPMDWNGGDPSSQPALPKPAIDPRNPFVGDQRFGRWEDVVPPPYVGKEPPPPWTGHRKFPNPYLEGGPSGFYSPGGNTWADDSSAPAAHLENQYKFRISGEDWTNYTRIDPATGNKQQWVQYTYEGEKWTRAPINLNVWGPKAPNEITGELGGVHTGSLAGISPPAYRGPWEPMTLPQIATLSAANPSVHFYMPDDCGFQFSFLNGVATGGDSGLGPILPSMIAGP
ncbi:hypothetical protein JF729_27365 [Mycobacterium intracellulare]|uniref:type VII secretion target n=1 Tax=Mycobacterium intracellulare TaxID=1767 RepID=UPI001CD9C7A3|nr:type VII secretion target [Mycobacterium intracellulare]MCA2251506.1 hypothetical protein [Mycobacterium intracellulare]